MSSHFFKIYNEAAQSQVELNRFEKQLKTKRNHLTLAKVYFQQASDVLNKKKEKLNSKALKKELKGEAYDQFILSNSKKIVSCEARLEQLHLNILSLENDIRAIEIQASNFYIRPRSI